VRSYSLTRQITLGLTATMLVASLCAFGWLYLKTEWTDAALRKETLLDQAKVIAGYLVVDDKGRIHLDLPPQLSEAYSGLDSSYRYAVRDADGQYLFDGGMTVAPLPALARNHRKFYDYDPDGTGPLHVFGAALRTNVGERTVFIQVEQRAHEPAYLRQAVVDEFITDGDWLEFFFLFVLLAVSIWIVKHAIAPLKKISALAESIGPANANVRLPLDQVPVEILPLVRSMNMALDHLEQGLQQQREFNANAAHQLRTPLAVLMANVDMLKESEIADQLRPDVEHMSRIVSQLLLAARLETLSGNCNETIDLNDAAADIAGNLAPLALASAKGMELIRNDRPVMVCASTFALKAALGNVIENAIRHTPEGTSVRLRVTDRPSIEVADGGPGIPVEQRARIFERFWRGDRSAGGAGLGLAIVDQIMKALHGTVVVDDAPGGGTLFTLIFPPAAIVPSASLQEPVLAAE
jgi:two-component system sensor histidine kinase TctE